MLGSCFCCLRDAQVWYFVFTEKISKYYFFNNFFKEEENDFVCAGFLQVLITLKGSNFILAACLVYFKR